MEAVTPPNNLPLLLEGNASPIASLIEKVGDCLQSAITGAQQRLDTGRTIHTRGRGSTSPSHQRDIPQIIITTPANPPTSLRRKTATSPMNLSPPPRSQFAPRPVSRTPPRQPATMAYRHAQCTHLTMVRLYTKELRCSVCLRVSSMGWLYRCSQDRELMMEQGAELGLLVSASPVEQRALTGNWSTNRRRWTQFATSLNLR